jgi:hypothetical protein
MNSFTNNELDDELKNSIHYEWKVNAYGWISSMNDMLRKWKILLI